MKRFEFVYSVVSCSILVNIHGLGLGYVASVTVGLYDAYWGMLVSWLPRRECRTLCEMLLQSLSCKVLVLHALEYPSIIIFLVNNRY